VKGYLGRCLENGAKKKGGSGRSDRESEKGGGNQNGVGSTNLGILCKTTKTRLGGYIENANGEKKKVKEW